MVKRFPLREFLWLCAPVAAIGAGFVAVRLLHPPRNPDAVIVLNVTSDSNPPNLSFPLDPTLGFGWDASARGGPRDDIQLLYTQKLVALGDGRSQILFQEPAPAPPNVGDVNVSNGGAGTGPAQEDKSQNLSIPYRTLPIWTKKLEWRGDFVAMPLQPSAKNASGVGIQSTFPTLARIKGAARVTKTIPLSFDARKVAPFQELKLGEVSPTIAEFGADTCVETRFRTNPRRICARLFAFDGKTKRELWSNQKEYDKRYWITGATETNNYVWNESQFLKLRDVPVQWGELIYIVDAAFNPTPGTGSDEKPVALAEIERLKKAGWQTDSKRLTLRKMGAKISAPNYSATPNTQFLGAKTAISKTDWTVVARLKYSGPAQSGQALDSPFSPEFSDAKSGYDTFVGTSYAITKSDVPGEYTATISVPLKALGQMRPTAMKMTIADPYAMPLHLQTKLPAPK